MQENPKCNEKLVLKPKNISFKIDRAFT